MFIELLVAGTIWFWLVLLVLTIIGVIACRVRWEGFGIFCLGIFFLAWWLLGDLAKHVQPDPWCLLWYPLGYIGIGLAWCIPKWIFFLDKIKRSYRAALDGFGLTKEKWKDWSSQVGCWWYDQGMSFDSHTGKLTPPQFNSNKERISGWAVLWPWSVTETLLGDVIKRIVDEIIHLCKWLFQAISDRMFREF